jgi:hypothetical protein
MVNLAFGLLSARRQRIEKLFHQLLGYGADHGLPVSTRDLMEPSKPVLELQALCNWIRDAKKDPGEELSELHSELPKKWLAELRTIVQAAVVHTPGQPLVPRQIKFLRGLVALLVLTTSA